jgi:hypothetical protein
VEGVAALLGSLLKKDDQTNVGSGCGVVSSCRCQVGYTRFDAYDLLPASDPMTVQSQGTDVRRQNTVLTIIH